MRLNMKHPDPANDYICDICNGAGYCDTGMCGMCEGGGKICWRPIDSQWIALPIKYKNLSQTDLEKLCDKTMSNLLEKLDGNS